MKCSSCGKDVQEGAKFCPSCGNSIEPNGNGVMNIEVGKSRLLPIIIGVAAFIIAFVVAYNGFGDKGNSNGNNGTVFGNKENEENNNSVVENKKNDIGKIGTETVTIKGNYDDEEIEAEVNVEDIYTTDSVYPKKPYQTFYHYYEKKEDNAYLVAILNVKNLGSTDLDTDHVFRNFLGDDCSLKATFDGKYDYNGFVVGLDKDSSGKYDLDSYYYIKPLKSAQIYVIFSIADEVKDKPATVNLCFGDNSYKLEK